MKKHFILTLLLIALGVSGVSAQWNDAGKFNVWTLKTFSRQNNASRATPYLKAVRAAKNKGYDRLVLEFTGDIPRYRIEYVKPPITGTADEEIKVAGKFFVSIDLQLLPYPDDEKLADAEIPKGKLNLPVIAEIREIEWFEGYRPFAVGLAAKKAFRVQQLKNPTRLVIDFKH